MSRRDELRDRLLAVAAAKRTRKEAIDAVVAEVLGPLSHDEETEEGGVVTERVYDGIAQQLRTQAEAIHASAVERELAASLLEAHDDTGINLARWPEATEWLRRFVGDAALPSNGA